MSRATSAGTDSGAGSDTDSAAGSDTDSAVGTELATLGGRFECKVCWHVQLED